MAFSFTKTGEAVDGNLRITSGTYNCASVTTGELYTGLQKVDGILLQQKSTAVVASQAVINETFPKADPITIVTVSSGTGYWMAWGS